MKYIQRMRFFLTRLKKSNSLRWEKQYFQVERWKATTEWPSHDWDARLAAILNRKYFEKRRYGHLPIAGSGLFDYDCNLILGSHGDIWASRAASRQISNGNKSTAMIEYSVAYLTFISARRGSKGTSSSVSLGVLKAVPITVFIECNLFSLFRQRRLTITSFTISYISQRQHGAS